MRALVLFVLLAGTATAQPARSSTASSNDRAVGEALAGFDIGSNGAAWDAVPSAFDALYPNTRYDQTRLTRVQARAIAFTAMTIAAGAGGRGPAYPSQPGYPTQGGASPRERALDLTYRFLSVAPTGGLASLPLGPERSAVIAQGAEAAGAAGAAGCTTLGRALTAIVGRIRSNGYAFSSDAESAQRAAEACR